MNKRLNAEQKYFAVVLTFSSATYPMTECQIGKHIGYANGQPVKHTVRALHTDGLLTRRRGKFMGKNIYWYWMSEENQKIALDDIRDNYGGD